MRFQYALVTLLVALSSAERIAGRDGLRIRQNSNDAAATADAPASSTDSEENPTSSPAPTESASRTNSDQDQGSKTASRTGDEASPITTTGTATNAPTSTSTSLPSANNGTDTENVLPIQPTINPPLGIAGVLLMLAGLALGFVGIKHKATQTFLSTALLVALGIEVLIVYLQKSPVPVAIQGAYLVAVVVGGVLVAGAALVFQEVCEGFGGVLGGFSFAMWLLVLAPGGTIKNGAGKIILVAMLCITFFCTYFSRFTRVYGLIVSTALAGSTAFVLGLDCFTRAGLKEFWLYIWNLNEDIFPLFTDTYPITRPIRAEVAAIIIIAFLGAMSQVKIWKVVKEQRQKRDAQRIQDEEARDAREEQVGRRVEDENRDTLAQWEHDYDGKKMPDVQIHDSGVGSIDEDYNSVTTSHKRRSIQLVNMVRHTTSEQNPATVQQSSSTVNLLPQGKSMHTLPEFQFDHDVPYYDETTGKTSYRSAKLLQSPEEPSTSATPGLEVPGISIEDRRHVAVKRLSLQSLNEKAAMEAAEDKTNGTPEEEDEVRPPYGSELASSAGASGPDQKSDTLSIALTFTAFEDAEESKRPHPMPSPEIIEEEEPVFEDDNDAIGKRRSFVDFFKPKMRRTSSGSPRSPGLSPMPSKERSGAGNIGAGEKPDGDLVECLPTESSRLVRYHRVQEWAKEVSRAEPEPIGDIEMDDPEAVRVEAGDAAEAARAAENNAAPAPPSPPTPPPEPKPQPKMEATKDRKLSTHIERSSIAVPTPIYSHRVNTSQDSWAVPLGKRSSSAQLLRTEPGSTPLDVMRNVSAPILEQPLVASPVASPEPAERAPSRDNPLSTVPGVPNKLLDQRKDRVENRLTSTSFNGLSNRPSTGLGINTPPKTLSNDSKEGSRDGSLKGNASTAVDSGYDNEDMTLAERKALVQRQSQLQLQNADIASRPLNSRQTSGYGLPEVRPPKAARISSQGNMQPIYDSHQPRRVSSHDVGKRAQNWNQWRTSQQIASTSRNPYMVNDNQQDMLRAMRQQTEYEAKLREQQKEAIQQQIDAHARMGGLNDAHAKALAKMQRQANKNAQ